jgi:hypothetical protein
MRVVVCRKEVRAFAAAMELKLRENDWKGGWRGLKDKAMLIRRTLGELQELLLAMEEGRPALPEAADAANFLMMLVDVYGDELQNPEAGCTHVIENNP